MTTDIDKPNKMAWFVPASIVGKARGICTSNKTCWRVEPNASAASTASGDTCLMPRLVRRIRGGTAKIKVAIIPETSPIPNNITTGTR